ncbi:MAG: glycoside hydrolase family 95 protein [Akkermansiaceae bacterium]|nr:glycoside hydrolase family 95 protein [Akkermansiaceae bacterium]
MKAALILSLALSSAASADSHRIWHDAPAANWEREALPIGNGSLGCMLFGGTDEIYFQFNQDSLWTGDAQDTGHYQSFGQLRFKFDQKHENISDYRRTLDLSTATHSVTYESGGTSYTRSAFASNPAGVIILHATANKRASYTGTLTLIDDHGTAPVAISDDTIQFTGALKQNGMQYAAQVTVVVKGGKSTKKDNTLRIENADTITFILDADTNYLADSTKNWRGGDPLPKIQKDIAAAVKTDVDQHLLTHVADHQRFYKRASVDFGTTAPELAKQTTKARLLNFWKNKNDADFEELVFNYGRYLLIASSREGTLPANLQGIWNNSDNPPWRGDYHSDINVDMNYWLSETTNLSELHRPFFDYVTAYIPVAKENTKKQYKTDGWAIEYENGIHGGGSYRWNHSGASWFAQQFWTHYAYTLDQKFLKEQALPAFRGVCEFWEDYLIEKDGSLVSPQGWSAEHGPTEDGVTYDQQFAWDAFTNYIETCEILGVEKEYAAQVAALRAKLMPLKIGKWGQLQEWLLVDRDKKQEAHRHLSHLVGLYPGRQINSTTPKLYAAAKKSLIARGDGGAGWALPWKAALWARYNDGEHAHQLLVNKLKPILNTPGRIQSGIDGTTQNLFTIVWGVFQIDGCLGYTGAAAEMLVQSHEPDTIHLLPALPTAWKSGHIKGFKARGGHTIDITWKDGKLTSATIQKGTGPLPGKILALGKEIQSVSPLLKIMR